MSLPDNFMWGGASAANQYEGGYNEDNKGLNAVDVLTNGSATEPRKVTWQKPDGTTGSAPMTGGISCVSHRSSIKEYKKALWLYMH